MEKYSPYQSLAVGSVLISLLEDEGVNINAAIAIEIQKILAHSETDNNTFAQLKYKIAPIISRNKEEQDKLYEIFDRLDSKILLTPTPAEPIIIQTKSPNFFQKITNKIKANKLITALIALCIMLPLIWFGYNWINKKQKNIPTEFKISTTTDIYKNELASFVSYFGDHDSLQTVPIYLKDFDSLYNQIHYVDWKINDKTYNNTFNPTATFDSAKTYQATAFLKNGKNEIIDTAYHQFTVLCERMPSVQIEKIITDDKEYDVYEPVFTNISKDSAKYTYQWSVDSKLVSTNKTLIIHQKTKFIAREIDLLVNDNGVHCSKPELIANRNESPKAISRIEPGSAPITIKNEVDYLKLGLDILFLLLLPLIFGAFIYNYLKNKNKKPEVAPISYQGTEGPYSIEFKNQDFLINADPELDTFIDKLRKRQLSELLKLNVKKTVKSAITTFGLTELFFKHQTKATDYVILFDKEHSSSHLTFLFGYLIKKLQAEQINITVYEYYKEPTFVSNTKMNLQQVPIERVAAMHAEATVLIFGDAKNFVFPIKKTVKPWVITKLSAWKTKILITPFAKNDWDIKERLVSEGNILIIPSDMNAQGNLDRVIFNKIDKQADLIIPDAYQARFLNLHTIEGLESYLTDKNLFNWVCALAVYPYTDWNLTLAIGHALEEKLKENDSQFSLVNYTNLLKLGRISWLHDSNWSDGLRVDMLEKLDDDLELLARKTVLEQLEAIKDTIGDNALIRREFDVHNHLNSFLVDVFEKNRGNSVKNEPNIKQMFELNHVDQGNEIYLKNANNTLLKDPKNKKETISIDKYLEKSSEIEEKNHLWKFYKSIAISVASILVLSMLAYQLINRNTNWLAINNTTPIDISFKINNKIDSKTFYSATVRIGNELKDISASSDSVLVFANQVISDTTQHGFYTLDNNENEDYTDSFKLNRTSYSMYLELPEEDYLTPVTILHSPQESQNAYKVWEGLSNKYILKYKPHTVAITEYEVVFSDKNAEDEAKAIADFVGKTFNQTIISHFGELPKNIASSIAVYIPSSDVELAAKLPNTIEEIWKGKTNNRKVTFNLQTNMFFYSTGADKTFGTYTIKGVTKLKSGTYKIVTRTNFVFLVRNISKSGFEISSCKIKAYSDAEIAKLNETNCGNFDKMVLMDFAKDENIDLPVKPEDIKAYFARNKNLLQVPNTGGESTKIFDYVRNQFLSDVYKNPLTNIIKGNGLKLTKNAKSAGGNPFVRGRLNVYIISSVKPIEERNKYENNEPATASPDQENNLDISKTNQAITIEIFYLQQNNEKKLRNGLKNKAQNLANSLKNSEYTIKVRELSEKINNSIGYNAINNVIRYDLKELKIAESLQETIMYSTKERFELQTVNTKESQNYISIFVVK